MENTKPLLYEFLHGCAQCKCKRGSLQCRDCHRPSCGSAECLEDHRAQHIEEEKKAAAFEANHRPYNALFRGEVRNESPVEENTNPSEPGSPDEAHRTPSHETSASEDLVAAALSRMVSVNSSAPALGVAPVRPVGIQNLSTTCYMNAALQMLLSMDLLRQFFVEGRHIDQINDENIFGHQGAICFAFADVCHEMDRLRRIDPSKGIRRTFENSYMKSANFFRRFSEKNPLYDDHREQHDSQEFLSGLLDCLHEDINRAEMQDGRKKQTELKQKGPDETDAECALRFSHLFNERDLSFIHDLFGGKFKNVIQCGSCQHQTTTFERFCLLSATLPTVLVKQVRVIVFPLPRGSPPVVVNVGLSHGAKSTDLADHVAKTIRAKKENMILVHSEQRRGDRPLSTFSVLDTTEESEDFMAKLRNTAGDVNRIPDTILAFEDTTPHSIAYQHPNNREDPFTRNNAFNPKGTEASYGSPSWDIRSPDDLRYKERSENGGAWHSLLTFPVIIDLAHSPCQHNTVWPIVFRVPWEATISEVRTVLLHAIQTMVARWGWVAEHDPMDHPSALRPSLKLAPKLCEKKNYTHWFKIWNKGDGDNISDYDESQLATKMDQLRDQVRDIWEPSKFGASNPVSEWWNSSPRPELNKDYAMACRANSERRNFDLTVYDHSYLPQYVPKDNHTASIQWQMEWDLIKILNLTGPGPHEGIPNEKGETNTYTVKFDGGCNFATLAMHHVCHLNWSLPNDPPGYRVAYQFRSAGYKHLDRGCPSGFGDYLSDEPWSIDDESLNAFDRHLPFYTNQPGEFKYKEGEPDSPFPTEAILSAMLKDNQWEPIYLALRRDLSLGEVIELSDNWQDDPKRLKAHPHFRLQACHLLDLLDLKELFVKEGGTSLVLTKFVNSQQIQCYEKVLNNDPFETLSIGSLLRVPIWTTSKLLTQNARCFSSPTLPRLDSVSIERLLERDRRPESMIGTSAWKCDKCHKQIESTKHHSVWDTGEYLIVNLKRFSYMAGSGSSRKNALPFKFPPSSVVDLSNLIDDPSQTDREFEVFASVVHRGSLESGHYIALVKGNPHLTKGWYRIDDEMITAVTEEEARREMEHSYIIALRKLKHRPHYEAPTTPLTPASTTLSPVEPQSGSDTLNSPSQGDALTEGETITDTNNELAI